MKPLAFRPHPWHGIEPGPRCPEIGDPTFGEPTAIAELPRAVIDRLRHYFLTYKAIPGAEPPGR